MSSSTNHSPTQLCVFLSSVRFIDVLINFLSLVYWLACVAASRDLGYKLVMPDELDSDLSDEGEDELFVKPAHGAARVSKQPRDAGKHVSFSPPTRKQQQHQV